MAKWFRYSTAVDLYLHFLELFGGSSFQKFAAKTKEKSLDSVSYTLSS